MQSSKIPLGEQGDSQGGTGPPLKNGRRRKPTNQTAAAVCPFVENAADLRGVIVNAAKLPFCGIHSEIRPSDGRNSPLASKIAAAAKFAAAS